jgi:hypothetical protein
MENTEVQKEEIVKSVKRVKKLPDSDVNVADVAQKVAENWLNKSLKLEWITAVEFKKIVDDFTNNLQSRKNEGLTRPQITQRLKELDKAIDYDIVYVKNYLTEEVGRGNESPYYAQLGIEKVGSMYKLPSDRKNKVSSLNILLKGIKDRGYADRQYGVAYWQPLIAEYNTLLTEAGNKDGVVSNKVNEKNKSKEKVLKVLNALIYLIRANYPDSYASELRFWGFQKEKY